MTTVEDAPTQPRRRPKVGWMFEGGGAKGAFSFAFARKLHALGVPMDAVSGTSVGALNAILFATGRIEDGQEMWETLDQAQVLPFRLPWPLHYLSFVLFFPHMVANFRSGRRAWVDPGWVRRIAETTIFLIHFLPAFVIAFAMFQEAGRFGKAMVALVTLWWVGVCVWLPKNESPEDLRKFQAMANAWWITIAKLGLVGGLARHAYLIWRIEPVPELVPGIWISCLISLLLLRGSVYLLHLTITDHSPLRERICQILQSPLRCPTYVTLAERKAVIDPDFPHWVPILAQPGEPVVYHAVPTLALVPRYFDLTRLDEPERISAVLGSTALPFGITPNVSVGTVSYIDGGMADNLPIRPLVDLEGCDIVLWLRINPDEQPEAEDREFSHPDPKMHWQWTWRREEVLAAEGEIEMTENPRHPETPTVVPWRKVAAGFPTVLRAVPDTSLGGVLNFKKKKQKERWTLGEEKADQFIREHRALLEPIISAARLDPGVVA